MVNDAELVEVRLIGLPLRIQRVASEHTDGLMREFALLAEQVDADPEGVPRRLIRLSRALRERFETFSAAPQAQLQKALERGDEAIDLTYRVPQEVSPAANELAQLLAEADAYCAAGKDLLTLVAPGKVVAYRNWFLGEFIRQVAGEPPTPWNEAAKIS